MTRAAAAWRRGASAIGAAFVVGYAALVGFASIRRPRDGVAAMVVPFGLLLLAYPGSALAAAFVFPAWTKTIPGASTLGGLNIGITDVLIAVTILGLIPVLLARPEYRGRMRDAKPALKWIAPYAAWLIVILAVHFSERSFFNAGQYLELTALALVLPIVLFDRRLARWAVLGFIGFTCVTAVMWIAHVGVDNSGFDKNPSGQFMVDAALLSLVVIRTWAIKGPAFLLLLIGTLYTESRGAVLGFLLGGIVLVSQTAVGNRRRAVGALVPVAALVVVAYFVLPVSAQNRLATLFSSSHNAAGSIVNGTVQGSLSSAQYTAELRVVYRREGIDLVKQHPLFGVGIGNYLTGNSSDGSLTNDPHNVLLLDAGEGGLPDAALYVVMIAGSLVVVRRRLRRNPWAGPALVVQIAIVTHGLLDVYWVRGTPLIGWLLIGMALNPRLDLTEDEATPARDEASSNSRSPEPVLVTA